jgi:hypothetical protein
MGVNYEKQRGVFDKIIQWLQEQKFTLHNVRRFSDPTFEVKFYCQIQILDDREDFIKLIIADQTEDSIFLQTTIYLEKDMIVSFN